MKLEHPVHAPTAGVVTDAAGQPGAQVDAGTPCWRCCRPNSR